MAHKSVLLKETIDALDLKPGETYLDATVGSGGHMEEVWKRFGSAVIIAGIDADETSLEISKQRLSLLGAKPKLTILNFRKIDECPALLEISNPDKIIFDLGWSTDQFNIDSEGGENGRGFSFLKDEPLIMTFSKNITEGDVTAYDVVNSWEEQNLADVIYGFGEEKYSRRIAKAIVERRKIKPIETSKELAEIIKNSVPVFYRFGRIHPATRTFQAIRIAVNDELRALQEGLENAFNILKPEGRLAVISFHSLEDRIVKNFIKLKVESEIGKIPENYSRKPISASDEELKENPRSRSAKLRVIQKK